MAGKGAPKTGGRQKGTKNKATSELKTLAREHTETCLNMARLATNAASEQARVGAIKELLDRGWGKPKQDVEHSGPEDGSIPVEITFTLDNAAAARDD
jgi:hypothetical protein